MKCPQCEIELDRNDVDVGPGVVYEPAACEKCGWLEADERAAILSSFLVEEGDS